MKIYKGYCILHDGEYFPNIFETTETFDSIKEFLEEESNFKEWLEEKLYDDFFGSGICDDNEIKKRVLEKINNFENDLNLEEFEKWMIQYNEHDEEMMYYSFTDPDNKEKALKDASDKFIKDFVDVWNDDIENDKDRLSHYFLDATGNWAMPEKEEYKKDLQETYSNEDGEIDLDALQRSWNDAFQGFLENNDDFLLYKDIFDKEGISLKNPVWVRDWI